MQKRTTSRNKNEKILSKTTEGNRQTFIENNRNDKIATETNRIDARRD